MKSSTVDITAALKKAIAKMSTPIGYIDNGRGFRTSRLSRSK